MTEQDAGWMHYKAMFLDDREQNRDNFERVFGKLDKISEQLAVMRTERKIGGWVVGVMVPATVALVFTGVAHAFGW